METNSSNSKGYNDFQKQVNRCMKYTNLNSKIDSVKKNRFIKLFSNSHEQYMFLLLRVMNAYAFFVQMNESLLYSNNEFRISILNYIFDPSFFAQFYPSFSYNFSQNSNEMNIPTEIPNENDIDLISIDVEDEMLEIKQAYSPFDSSILLNHFFDLHFSCIDKNIFFIAYFSYISNQIVPEDNYKEYSIYSQMNNNYVPYPGRYVKYIPIDEKLLTFIDNVLTTSYPTQQIIQNQINVFFTKNQYWSTQRRSIFHNYLQNWGIKKILQIKAYTKCTVHFSTTFYEWRMSSENQNSSIVKLDENQMALQINHFMPQSIETLQMNFANNDTNCLDIGFFSPNSRTKKTNYTLIKKYICYFTMNNANVLDNLALDFVNIVLKQNFSHKNTVIYGDYDKYNKWINLFNPTVICNTGLIAFYPYPLPIQTIGLINLS